MVEPNLGDTNIVIYKNKNELSSAKEIISDAASLIYSHEQNLIGINFSNQDLEGIEENKKAKNYVNKLKKENRIKHYNDPKEFLESPYGNLIYVTSDTNPTKKISERKIVSLIRRSSNCSFLIGLKEYKNDNFFKKAQYHYDLSKKGIYLSFSSKINSISTKISTLLSEYEKNPKVTVDIIVKDEKKGALLVKRKNYPYQDHWAIPGGFVEYNESVEDAARREMKEETGIDVELTSLLGVFSKPGRDPRGHIVTCCFLAKVLRGKLKADTDAKEVNWTKNIRNLKIAFDHRKILNKAGIN